MINKRRWDFKSDRIEEFDTDSPKYTRQFKELQEKLEKTENKFIKFFLRNKHYLKSIFSFSILVLMVNI